mmetsp:Transcript_20421/g.51409  ORF Transcript_20421/g.51409 Transcript_20421/m.51409 type:complete len:381 (+) Transcript_20421:380-1522(+)|eukprot:jgi/Tetstr1/456404/TSEL_043138.t1
MAACAASACRKLRRCGELFVEELALLGAHGTVFLLLQNWSTRILAAEAAGFCLFYVFFEGIQAVDLNWQYVSFAVVFPVVFFVKETWMRREDALSNLADIKTMVLAIYLCNRDWVKPEAMDPDHVDKARMCLSMLVDSLKDYLMLPRLTTRDLYFDVLQERRLQRYHLKRVTCRRRILRCTAGLSRLAAHLRDFGMTGPERIRLGSYHRQLSLRIEETLNIKDYRTPQGARSLGRIDALLMFTVFGVYFAWVAEQTNSILFATVLAAGFGQALGVLINIGAQLEDPFNTNTSRDQVNVVRDLQEVLDTIQKDETQPPAAIDAERVVEMADMIVRRETMQEDELAAALQTFDMEVQCSGISAVEFAEIEPWSHLQQRQVDG